MFIDRVPQLVCCPVIRASSQGHEALRRAEQKTDTKVFPLIAKAASTSTTDPAPMPAPRRPTPMVSSFAALPSPKPDPLLLRDFLSHCRSLQELLSLPRRRNLRLEWGSHVSDRRQRRGQRRLRRWGGLRPVPWLFTAPGSARYGWLHV
jgi:hypothetical protein